MFIPIIMFVASAAFSTPLSLTNSADIVSQSNPESLGAYVREYFSDIPILAEIAWCESTMRHLDREGNVLRGVVDSDDVGVMQINTRFHLETAEKLNIDIFTLNGNLAYARYLYEKQGTQPWSASRPCWGDKIALNN